jgi:hypothetical protein
MWVLWVYFSRSLFCTPSFSRARYPSETNPQNPHNPQSGAGGQATEMTIFEKAAMAAAGLPLPFLVFFET